MSTEQLPATSATPTLHAVPAATVSVNGTAPKAAGTVTRLLSLDAYRGIVMLLMASAGLGFAPLLKTKPWGEYQDVMNNEAGESQMVWLQHASTMFIADQLEHRLWEGCTLWDLIQPAFMFIVGVSMVFSFRKRLEQGYGWNRQFGHMAVRFALLCSIGFLLDSYSQTRIHVQFIRVLQQIAIGSLIAFFSVHRNPTTALRRALLVLMLHTTIFMVYGVGDWQAVGEKLTAGSLGDAPSALMEIVRTPEDFFYRHPEDVWAKEKNAGYVLDIALHAPFAGWTYLNVFPVSTGFYCTMNALSSAGTILFGVACGGLLLNSWSKEKKMLALVVVGIGGLVLGWAVSPIVPMVKRIWTGSFAIYAAGWTSLFMAFFFLVIDYLNLRKWSFPLVVVGMNSIAMYVLASLLRTPIENGLKPFVELPLKPLPITAPIVRSVLVLVVLWGFCFWLYRRKIFFKL